jgi:excisionase family DNA binding protein
MSAIPNSKSPAADEATEPQQPDRLLVGMKEAARLLSLSERTMSNLTAPHGPIVATRIGRLVRFSMASLERFVRESEGKQC